MFEEKDKSCSFPAELVEVNVGLACFDGVIAILAFTQVCLFLLSDFLKKKSFFSDVW